MKTYSKAFKRAVAELQAMVDWRNASNGAFLYLRHADCQRFLERHSG